ncbi:MAG: AAA domain-containing protein [Candidatus Lokiarchaeota archaeon]|nr:AAA domain-containing protein [Candidatus Lokiarchaeota archaeon]
MEDSAELVRRFETFFRDFITDDGSRKYENLISQMELNSNISLNIDYDDLLGFDEELARGLLDSPEHYINLASMAIKHRLRVINEEYANSIEEFHARFKNLEPTNRINLRKIRSSHIGKLIQVSGILTRANKVTPLMVRGVFRCLSCNDAIIPVDQEDNEFTRPLRCPNCDRKGPFKLLLDRSSYIDWQKIRVQEKPEELPAGQLPRFIDGYLLEDIVDKARPGERVTLVGILKAKQISTQQGKLTIFRTYIDINHIEKQEVEIEHLDISTEEEERIKELANDPWIYRKLVRSIAPSIYGLEEIKEALLLLLFSGVSRTRSDGTIRRGQVHILFVGDPGVGKSQLLKSSAEIAPRGIYTSGKGSTAAGLTAAVLRDKDTGNLSLEAGVLVLADRGIACIDEFDKMRSEDRVAIHEAMEQLSISIAKAGIIASLNSRTSILAAANPYYGRYDEYKTVAENIKKLPPTLLSRFDLIFILKDRPNPTNDERMADFILSSEENPPDPPIDRETLKNYIYYAKKNFRPRITPTAVNEIKSFYLETRTAGAEPDTPVPITARYLEAMIRLAEARAKMALHEEVTVEDAQAVIQLMRYSLRQVGIDQETGISDIDAIETGITRSHRRRLDQLAQIIGELIQDRGGEAVSLEEITEAAARFSIREEQVESDIGNLRARGILYEPQRGRYKIVEE